MLSIFGSSRVRLDVFSFRFVFRFSTRITTRTSFRNRFAFVSHSFRIRFVRSSLVRSIDSYPVKLDFVRRLKQSTTVHLLYIKFDWIIVRLPHDFVVSRADRSASRGSDRHAHRQDNSNGYIAGAVISTLSLWLYREQVVVLYCFCSVIVSC